MPLIGIRNELSTGDLKIIPALGFPIKSKWHLIWLKEKKLSPAAEAYIAYIRKHKEKVLNDHFAWITTIHRMK